MYIRRNYGFWMTFNWSKLPFIVGGLYALIVYLLHDVAGISIALPWQPISIIGIAVAFYLGFKNNSSYDRTWEARKIWGAIVNHSRTWATTVISFLGEEQNDKMKELVYRHLAWLTALRYQLRLSREWEHTKERILGAYIPTVCESYFDRLNPDLKLFLSDTELVELNAKSNLASQLLKNQSDELRNLFSKGVLSEFKHVKLQEIIGWLYDEQGKCERIKNFPFPRQYASTALWLTFVFAALIPFGMMDIFAGYGNMMWLSVPFSAMITWVFFLMEKIGDYSENPFEGTYNDVPISSIARTIEIDLREMINDTGIPEPVIDDHGYLM
jgi:ion channel-forming bestrophin family protein